MWQSRGAVIGVDTSYAMMIRASRDIYNQDKKAVYNHEEKNHATCSMLKWFVDEQVEEEANVEAIVRKLEFVGDSHASIYLLDKELGGR